MKGNQGLEALAALCGGQTDAPTEIARRANKSREEAVAQLGTSSHGTQQSQPAQASVLQPSQRQNPSANQQQSALQNVTQQQWQQAIAAAAALQGGGVNPALAAQSFLMSGGLSQHNQGENTFSTMQQLAFHQYVQAQANHTAQQASQLSNQAGKAFGDQGQQAIMRAFATGNAQQLQQVHGGHQQLQKASHPQQQVIPSAASPTSSSQPSSVGHSPAVVPGPAPTSMKPPPPPKSQGVHSLTSTLSTAGILNQGNGVATPHHATIAPMPGGKILPNNSEEDFEYTGPPDNKKHQKRAANRRSAQLSRKRKKAYIEELKDENDELRRKEQILRSIPDLIVVFDSSGRLSFVSQSVARFIDMTPEELEGTSFWDRLCEDSVRLLKAAFMDSLAARQTDAETAPLGSGVWELRFLNKDGGYNVVTLNGVVHFSGDAPECVCCIRPRDQKPSVKLHKKERSKTMSKSISRTVSSSDGSRSSDVSNPREHPQIRVKPNQSVITSDNSSDDSVNTNGGAENRSKIPRRDDHAALNVNGLQVVRISDGESGSDDGI